jgi:PAS domain S-box-containing protein
MACNGDLRMFARSRAGANFLKFLVFCVILAAGIGYGVYHFSVASFTVSKSEEKITALRLVDAFVSEYTTLRTEFHADNAPVPATFRAHSIDHFNKARSGDNVLRLLWIGRPGREIKTPPTDARMAEIIDSFAQTPNPKPQSSFLTVEDQYVFRTVYPSIASQQACIDCHNRVQPDKPQWRLNDVMGAFSIDVPAGAFLRTTFNYAAGLALVVFVLVGGVGLIISLLHFRQISEREAAQVRIKASEERFRDFAESASDWFWEQDETLRFSYLSDPVRHSGLEPHAHLGKTRREVVSVGVTDHQWEAHQADLDARRPFQNFRIQRLSPTGELRTINVSGKAVFDDHGTFRGYRGTAKDITAEVTNEMELARRVEERTAQLHDAQAELLRKERLSLLGQLTATVAHELRNPLSSIRNSIYTIKEIVAAGERNLDRPLSRVERGIARCDRIVGDLLDYARSRELQRISLVLDEWLAEVLDEQKLHENIALSRMFGTAGTVVSFDPDRLRRVIVNLVENAEQALLESGAAGRTLRIDLATRVIGDRVEITVADNGPGIPLDILPKIFEPLFSTKSFGSGLGLPTVKQIVDQHGGDIEISSQIGSGTVVTLRLPLMQIQEIAA